MTQHDEADHERAGQDQPATGDEDTAPDRDDTVPAPTDATPQEARPAHHSAYGPRDGYERSADESRRTRLRDIFGAKWLLLLFAVMGIQLAFIASYVGAFHSQHPHQLQVSVISNHNWQEYVSNQLNKIPGQPVYAYAETDEAHATDDLKHGKREAVYVFDPNGDTDKLVVATATGSSNAQAMEVIFQQVAANQHRKLIVDDVMPVQSGDARGLSGFYLTVGWLVGGYIMAALVGLQRGQLARNWRRELWRLALAVTYAVVSGVLGALIVDTWLGALTGHFWWLVLIGTLLSLSASLCTMGLEAIFGVVGVGIAILLFVVLGNPSAGGAFNYQLLPQPWSFIGRFLPNGAGVDSIRSVVYLHNADLGMHLAVLGWWIAVGLLALLLASNNTYWGFRRPEHEAPAGRSSGSSDSVNSQDR